MELFCLDKNFTTIAILDSFESLLWIERYYEVGEFELYAPISQELLSAMQIGYYLWRKDSQKVMIIESVKLEANSEDGHYLTATGRSLESILDRRIIWEQTRIQGNLQNGIKKLITDAIISPKSEDRKISNFRFLDSTDSAVTSIKVDAQFTGDNLYEAIKSLCQVNDLGFKISLNEDYQFVFELYAGETRDYTQVKNPYVTFSPEFDNLQSSSYFEDITGYKTIVLVAGEGEGSERRTAICETGATVTPPTGMDRREMYVDARDLSSTEYDEEGNEHHISDEEYGKSLITRGFENLDEQIFVKDFEGGVDPFSMFKYDKDYYLGDVVQIRNEFAIEARVRVTEVIRSNSVNGDEIYPTFSIVDEEEYQGVWGMGFVEGKFPSYS